MKRIADKLLFTLLTIVLSIALFSCTGNPKVSPKALHIVMPYTEQIENIDSNYYIQWLETQTGFDIQVDFISKDYTNDYLRLLFNEKNSTVDGIFFFPNSNTPLAALVEAYGQQGKILPLNDFIDAYGLNTKAMIKDFAAYDLNQVLKSEGGNIYYLPSISNSIIPQDASILWINSTWLKSLSLPIPKTTDDLVEILHAFKSQDPNENGIPDEIALISGSNVPSKQGYNYIINAFVYNDPYNCRMAIENGKVYFTPATEEWRNAMIYCHELYAKGLLHEASFSLNEWQLAQLVSDPRDLVGSFSSPTLMEILSDNSSDFMEKFIYMKPLQGSDGTQYATATIPSPQVAGIIPASCKYPKETFMLMDLMLSPEASLISKYGEQGVDWDFGQSGDVDFFSNSAELHVKEQLRSTVQNKHLAGAGPLYLKSKYVDSITLSGVNSDKEYLHVRAAMIYIPHTPDEYIKTIHFEGTDAANLREVRHNIEVYVEESIQLFITGKLNPADDNDWHAHLNKLSQLEITRLTTAVQSSYENTN